MRIPLIIAALFFLTGTALTAQESSWLKGLIQDKKLSIGLFAGIGPGFHSGNFARLKDIPSCCPAYENGYGTGANLGIMAKVQQDSLWFWGFRAGYWGMGGTFSAEQQEIAGDKGVIRQITFTHTLKTSLGILAIEPMAGIKAGPLQISGGPWLGIPISTGFEQKETVFPGTFQDGSRIRNQFSGSLPGAPLIVPGISAQIAWPLRSPAGNAIQLVPALSIVKTFGEFSTETNWNTLAIRAGLAIMFTPEIPKMPPPPPPDTTLPPPPPPPPDLKVNIAVSAIDSNGIEKSVTQLAAGEIIYTEAQPLLPYIFFEDKSAQIPARYVQDPAQFSEGGLKQLPPLQRYHQLLNIAGKRMKERPQLRLTITGCASGGLSERGNRDLARRRAMAIQDYLLKEWQIDSQRIQIIARDVPENPTNILYPEGQAENRRAELQFNEVSSLETLTLRDTLQKVLPDLLEIRPAVKADAGLQEWRTTLSTYSGRMLYEYYGKGMPDRRLEWKPVFTELPKENDSLILKLEATDAAGQKASISTMLGYTYSSASMQKNARTKGGREIRTYSLILFNFDRAELDERNARILYEIRKNLPATGAHITITGSTDVLGDEKRNKALALERARATAAALNMPDTIIEGQAGTGFYPNDLPEGRFYNRTVEIRVETGGE
jgi:outer membrane protein OmpA-like peptidoglycan-associated protein